ncbi:hypothetical protein TWF481_010302 [Arthrobotrys musiformis]|uniref:C2H2-type domain-containing protein n=1 Tax=Arthrobotrys musiformis TaxID=47236 RepID=A0AAV9W0G4_9PEZI
MWSYALSRKPDATVSNLAPGYTAATIVKSEPAENSHPLQQAFFETPFESPLHLHYPPSSCSGFDDGSILDTNQEFPSRASPNLPAIPEYSKIGQKCIFHWLPCQFRADHFDDWFEHVQNHITTRSEGVDSVNKSTLETNGMPKSWRCSFGCEFRIEENRDPKSLWKGKLRHIYQHVLDGDAVESSEEDPAWMEYYRQYLGIQKQAMTDQGRNFKRGVIPVISNKQPIRSRRTVAGSSYQCPAVSGANCRCVFGSYRDFCQHLYTVHKIKAFGCSCGRRFTRLDNFRSHKRRCLVNEADTRKSKAQTSLSQHKRPYDHSYTKPIPELNDANNTHDRDHIKALKVELPSLKKRLKAADIIYALQTDGCERSEALSRRDENLASRKQIPTDIGNGDEGIKSMDVEQPISSQYPGCVYLRNFFETAPNSDEEPTNLTAGPEVTNTQGKAGYSLDRAEHATEAKIEKYIGGSPRPEASVPSSFDTGEPPSEAGESQTRSTIVPDCARSTIHQATRGGTIDSFGNQLLRETAARVKVYALQTVAEVLRQKLTNYLLRFSNPNVTAGTGETSSSGEPVSSAEPGNQTPLQTAKVGQGQSVRKKRKPSGRRKGKDDENGEDEDNRKKRLRTSKPSPGTPCTRYACIYFANAMKSKDTHLLNLDLTRWQTECYRSGFETIARLKSHLYSHHQWGCKKCYRNFPTAEAHHEHSHDGCQESTEIAPVFLSREQITRLKSKKPLSGVDTEGKRWRSIYRLVFPDQENIPSPYWEPISLNCKKKHIEPSQLLNLLKRQFEAVLLSKELLKPLDEALLGLKLVWGNVVDAIMENYPISENPSDADIASLKAIFENIMEDTTQSNTRNVGSDSTPSLVNSTNTTSETTSDAAPEPFQRIASPTLTGTSILDPLVGLDNSKFSATSMLTELWKFDPFTGEPLGGQFTRLDEVPLDWLNGDFLQSLDHGLSKNAEVE